MILRERPFTKAGKIMLSGKILDLFVKYFADPARH